MPSNLLIPSAAACLPTSFLPLYHLEGLSAYTLLDILTQPGISPPWAPRDDYDPLICGISSLPLITSSVEGGVYYLLIHSERHLIRHLGYRV